MSMQAFLTSGRLFILTVYKKTAAEIKKRIPSFFKYLNIHSVLAIAGIIGPLILTASDLTAAVANADYSLVRDSISSLALTRIGWLQTIGFLAQGLLLEIFAAGLLFNVKRRQGFHIGIAIFVIFGFAMLLIGAFRTDPANTVEAARTIEGRIHGLTASTAFLLFLFAILLLMPSLKHDPAWKILYRYTGVTFILAVILVVITRIVQETSGWFGLAERLLVANMIIWVEVTAIRLFILSLKRGVKAQVSAKNPSSA